VLNSVQPVISGVAIGGGWQALVAYINLGCYYALGLPLGFCLGCLLRLGAEGMWAGMLCGTALQTLILLAVIWNTDWEAEVRYSSRPSIRSLFMAAKCVLLAAVLLTMTLNLTMAGRAGERTD
jgi:Na+-driven multidrug efflux pump